MSSSIEIDLGYRFRVNFLLQTLCLHRREWAGKITGTWVPRMFSHMIIILSIIIIIHILHNSKMHNAIQKHLPFQSSKFFQTTLFVHRHGSEKFAKEGTILVYLWGGGGGGSIPICLYNHTTYKY